MALWNQLRQQAASMQSTLVSKKNDLKSGAFRDAAMAMCALIAAADGNVDAEERRKVAALIGTNEVLLGRTTDWAAITRYSKVMLCLGGLPLRNGLVTSGAAGVHSNEINLHRAAESAGAREGRLTLADGVQVDGMPAEAEVRYRSGDEKTGISIRKCE